MNIKILDSHLRDFLETNATPTEIAKSLSLSSVSVEKVEKIGTDYLYEIEVTTNRADLFSVTALAKETAAILKASGKRAKYNPPNLSKPEINDNDSIEIKSDPKLVNRILAVVMEVEVSDSPKEIRERLEASDIRSLNNLIDITNYVMRTIGHPSHVFDFDRLNSKTLTIREAKKGEKITTLDDKEYELNGEEIVALDDRGEIIDLLGIMGLKNSVVNNKTRKILYFLDNNESTHIRRASMRLGIRSEAAILNEKGIDPELAWDAFLYGINLYEKLAKGKVVSKLIDIYPNRPTTRKVSVEKEMIDKIIGVDIPLSKSAGILNNLGLESKVIGKTIIANVPSSRLNDIEIEEDIIEEIARVYGYHNIPSIVPSLIPQSEYNYADRFYFEKRVKDALKYWGLTETYTYSMVSEDLLEGPEDEAVKIQNPLTEDFEYMRRSLVPSLLKVVKDNKSTDEIKIFELSNTYHKRGESELPSEVMMLAGLVKKNKTSFYEVKGLIEQLLLDIGVDKLTFKNSEKGGLGASVYIQKEYIGEIEVLDKNTIDFELNFEKIMDFSNIKKEYKPINKFPSISEDFSVETSQATTQDLINDIHSQDNLITDVSLIDTFESTRTFRVVFQNPDRNLKKEEIAPIREKIISSLKKKFKASIK